MNKTFALPGSRATLVQLTQKALKTVSFGCTQFKHKVSELFADFTVAEQEQFFKLLMKMRTGLIDREVIEKPDLHETSARG
jgi:hypothetical protein